MASPRKLTVISKRGLFQSFQETVAAQRLWGRDERLLVGVSGGPDSVALLHLLCATSLSHRLVVAHVNHQLRGVESDRDERFVHDLCARWGVTFEGARVNTATEAKSRGESIEESARRQRYLFFGQIARDSRIRKILVAHNRNDQAETFLLRLLRGAGRRGLGGMKMVSPVPTLRSNANLVRPLLRISRADILDYLKKNRISFRRDKTNRDEIFFRNRIRNKLIPLIEREFQPSAVEVFARTAEILADEDRVLEQGLLRLGQGPRVAGAKLLKIPEGLRGRALCRWLEARGCPSPSWERVEALLQAVSSVKAGARRIQFASGHSVRVKNGSLEYGMN